MRDSHTDVGVERLLLGTLVKTMEIENCNLVFITSVVYQEYIECGGITVYMLLSSSMLPLS